MQHLHKCLVHFTVGNLHLQINRHLFHCWKSACLNKQVFLSGSNDHSFSTANKKVSNLKTALKGHYSGQTEMQTGRSINFSRDPKR